MKITDRPGRYFAIIIFAPTQFYCGIVIREDYLNISNILILLSILLFIYEIFWIFYKNNKTSDIIIYK